MCGQRGGVVEQSLRDCLVESRVSIVETDRLDDHFSFVQFQFVLRDANPGPIRVRSV